MEPNEAPPVAGPGPIGHSVAIARGTYSEILSISAPASASPGDTVTVEVRVQSFYHLPIDIAVTSRYNGVDLFFSPDYALLDTYAVGTFIASFIMPNNDIRLDVWSFYWSEDGWYQDDYNYVDIALAGVTEPYKGTISRMELEYNEARANIPAYNIPQNESGLVHIWGRNDMDEAQQMGIYWIVKDPDGLVVEEYENWEAWPYTGAGDTHEFMGGRFNLDKVGTYTLLAYIIMNFDNPEFVDIYAGDLCTVAAAVPESEFRGFGVTEYTKR